MVISLSRYSRYVDFSATDEPVYQRMQHWLLLGWRLKYSSRNLTILKITPSPVGFHFVLTTEIGNC